MSILNNGDYHCVANCTGGKHTSSNTWIAHHWERKYDDKHKETLTKIMTDSNLYLPKEKTLDLTWKTLTSPLINKLLS